MAKLDSVFILMGYKGKKVWVEALYARGETAYRVKDELNKADKAGRRYYLIPMEIKYE